jgi:hypothetical protein
MKPAPPVTRMVFIGLRPRVVLAISRRTRPIVSDRRQSVSNAVEDKGRKTGSKAHNVSSDLGPANPSVGATQYQVGLDLWHDLNRGSDSEAVEALAKLSNAVTPANPAQIAGRGSEDRRRPRFLLSQE